MADEKDDRNPKIIVDNDWKAQARAEKERMAMEQSKAAEQAKASQYASASAAPSPAGAAVPGAAAAPGGRPASRKLPDANFATLVNSIASQALFAMGAIADPQSGRRFVDLDVAKHQIDTMRVLDEVTANNLTEDEKQLLDRTLYELRNHYVQVVQRVAKL